MQKQQHVYCAFRRVLVSFLLGTVVLEGACAAKHPFVLVSDLHYDSLYGTPYASDAACTTPNAPAYGILGCDSPSSLLDLLIADINSNAANNTHLLFTGDWLRHNISLENSVDSFTRVSQLLQSVVKRSGSSVLPVPAVAAAIGNNDFIPDHYLDVSKKEQPLLQTYSTLMENSSLLTNSEALLFNGGGYYYRDLVKPRLRIIVLNTELYHPSINPPINPSLNPDPLGQIAFLSSKLDEASKNGLPTIIIGHVPPTMNAFYCVQGDYRTYIQDEFLSAYARIIKQFSTTIVFQFFGHAHQLSFLADKKVGVPGIIVPGISPIFRNSPSYLTADYDDEKQTFQNFRMRHFSFSEAIWSTFTVLGESSIDKLLGPVSTLDDLSSTVAQLGTDHTRWGTYLFLHAGGQTANLWPGIDATTVRRRHLCSMLQFSKADYMQCIDRPLSGEATRRVSGGVIAVCVISFLLGLGGMLYAFIHLRQMSHDDIPIKIEEDVEMDGS